MTDLLHPTINKLLNKPYFHLFLLLIITILAAFLRFYKLGEWSFWIDELFTIRNAAYRGTDARELYLAGSPDIKSVPFSNISFWLVGWALNIFGVNEWSARFFPALIGTLSVPILYFPTKKMLNMPIALISVFLLAISPWHVYFSQNARYFAAILLFYTLALFLFFLSVENNKAKYLVLSALFVVLAFLERLYAVLVIPVAFSYLFLLLVLPFKKPHWLKWKYVFPLIIVPIPLYVIFELYNTLYLGNSFGLSVLFSPKFFGSQVLVPRDFLTGPLTEIGIPLIIVGLFGSFAGLVDRRPVILLLTVGAWLPIIMFSALAAIFFTQLHYTIVVLFCWHVLGAIGILELSRRTHRSIVGVWIIGILITVSWLRDRVIRDLLYYWEFGLGHIVYVLLIMVLFGVVIAFFINRTGRENSPKNSEQMFAKFGSKLIWLGITFIIVAHPFIALNMYYTYQHGYREDMRSAVAIINQSDHVKADTFITEMPVILSYYLKKKTLDIRFVDYNAMLQAEESLWVIDNYGLREEVDDAFQTWSNTHCSTKDELDRFVRGRVWELNILHCQLDAPAIKVTAP
jgi:4-amino-4-deoxy-L-arabinose transferase-like glycosyltransferase